MVALALVLATMHVAVLVIVELSFPSLTVTIGPGGQVEFSSRGCTIGGGGVRHIVEGPVTGFVGVTAGGTSFGEAWVGGVWVGGACVGGGVAIIPCTGGAGCRVGFVRAWGDICYVGMLVSIFLKVIGRRGEIVFRFHTGSNAMYDADAE